MDFGGGGHYQAAQSQPGMTLVQTPSQQGRLTLVQTPTLQTQPTGFTLIQNPSQQVGLSLVQTPTQQANLELGQTQVVTDFSFNAVQTQSEQDQSCSSKFCC